MGAVDEVGNMIAEAGPGVAAIDEGEVDDEFEAMLADERKKEEEAERIKREAQEGKEAEETRRKLAELEKIGPIPNPTIGQTVDRDKENRPLTPVTAAATELNGMHIDTTDEPRTQEPEKIPAE
jgi:charged multivesicular body protein 7